MRHQKSGRALGVKSAHRRAMMRNMVTSVLEHQRITTTVTRAKELRQPLDKLITLGKKGDLTARRNALSFVKSKKAIANLFGDFAERYADRPGGFSRIIRIGRRRGDGAEMATMILVGSPTDPFMEDKQPVRKRGGGAKERKVVDEVVEEVSAKADKKASKAKDEAVVSNAAAETAETQTPVGGTEATGETPEAESAAEGDAVEAAVEEMPADVEDDTKKPKEEPEA